MIFQKIRTLFTLFIMAITISFLIIFMYLFRKNNKYFRQKWSAMQMKFLGITVEIEGEQDPNVQMQVMNHQSILDIILFEYLHSQDLAWVAKIEIGNIPWFGHIVKAPKMILVERESKKSLVKLLKDAKDRLEEKRTLVIFPEGTRSDGKKLLKFKAGTRIIAERFNLSVQPVVVIGTRKILDSQNLKQESGVVKVKYFPTVQATKGTNWYKEMEEMMRKEIEKEFSNDT